MVVWQLPKRLNLEQGRILFGDLERSIDAIRPRIVLDCSKLRHLDCAGLRVLLRCLEEAMKRNGDVKLAAVSPATAAIMELTKVDRLFETFDNPSAAVNSYDPIQVHALPQAYA